MSTLLVFGLGYCARAVADVAADFTIVATSRSVAGPTSLPRHSSARTGHRSPHRVDAGGPVEPGRDGGGRQCPGSVARTGQDGEPIADEISVIPFNAAVAMIASATHILVSVPPGPDGDPVLNRYTSAIAAAPGLQWIGYLSSIVVYGDRGGAWVDEETPPAPSQPRGQRRLDAELAWSRLADRCAVDIIRLAGIYGPARSAFDDLRGGTARRMIKPGHRFGRIHRDDIGRAVAAAMRQAREPGRRILNFSDNEPSESAAIVTEAARLMGIAPPPEITFADAVAAMSPMAKSFWAENRKVSSQKTQQSLGLSWLYPSFREGLAAIWREECGDRPL